MAKARKYPGADTTRWFGSRFAGLVSDDLDKLLLHSTETPKNSGCPGYANGTMAPTLTINPWPGYRKVWQHFDLNQSGRALANPASTPVSENKDRVCQIEIIGYSDKKLGKARGCYLMDLEAESLQWLAEVFAFIMREWTIPNVWASPFPWPIYPDSYGNSPSRMTSSEYDRFEGVLGHLHASGNSHGDPSLPVADLRARVAGLLDPIPVKPEGFLMALTDKQQDDLYNRVMGGIPEGDVRGRKNPDGSPARVLTSADGDYLRQRIAAATIDPAQVAAAMMAALPSQAEGAPVTDDQLERVLRKVLSSLGEEPTA